MLHMCVSHKQEELRVIHKVVEIQEVFPTLSFELHELDSKEVQLAGKTNPIEDEARLSVQVLKRVKDVGDGEGEEVGHQLHHVELAGFLELSLDDSLHS